MSHHDEGAFPLLTEHGLLFVGFTDFLELKEFWEKMLAAGLNEEKKWNAFDAENDFIWGRV